ncbi:tRNA (adenosine(37)-N6)-threonylcarbamoyltransferase complex transferase subunit TsaD [uncultured Algimonas sp.]|uniref:tRNA (adenosine(37)-N6)-threonylcarbamoyltransferase complex transferase subunit TsaD n=1 Tax=uncultured Algimonas sp. TaxID=1547920 RepID=UPI002608EE95|nr:tRNA (adenosine(37)-N6)-threonylcarbamoyltransferase complex transferase subunit TsaD [uncultured Algimonas sp.]
MPLAATDQPRQSNVAPALVLGIESSCDETAAAVLCADRGLLSNIVASQDEAHRPYGGVVPEIAARAHMSRIDTVIDRAVTDAGIAYDDLSAVAATSGPGLIGGVITGLMAAKGLSSSLGVPLVAVNHLEGHALSPRLTEDCPFPYLLLLVSGGHSQLLSVTGLGDYERLGSTIDDAAGEAFDKTAKVMGLGFPGGPNVERWAELGDPQAIPLPRPLLDRDSCDFSFAGLKTAVTRAFAASDRSDIAKADLAASFQRAVADCLADRTERAMARFKADHDGPHRFVVAGGVAANRTLRERLVRTAERMGFTPIFPPLQFCGDNAAMIARAGLERLQAGSSDPLSAPARPRWPLDTEAAHAAPASGSGRKGPKS